MARVLPALKRHAQELISDPSLAAKTTLLYFNKMQSCIVTGLLTGHNTIRGQCYMRLIYSPLCERRGAEKETTALVLWECEALATHIPTWGPFSWTQEMLEI